MRPIDTIAAAQRLEASASACYKPPADPQAPGLNPGKVAPGPNAFKLGIEGPEPLVAVGGTHDQQEHQRHAMLSLAGGAAMSYLTGHLPGGFVPRMPSDADLRGTLNQLDLNPPIGTDGVDVTHAVYQSQIPNASPQEVYDHFVNSPGEVFSAGGMEIRPPALKLEDGGRYMLEIGGPVPTWLPVEIRLDPGARTVTIHTLDGHVLRGEQTFSFTSDCHGGTTLTQDARFQGSTELVGDMQKLASVSAGQHQAWENAHREIYEQFNGDRDYAGMGTGLFNQQQKSAWLESLGNVVLLPGTAADVAFDVAGELTNEGIDDATQWVGGAMDWAGIKGGHEVREVGDVVGDVSSTVADKVGDIAKFVIDINTPW